MNKIEKLREVNETISKLLINLESQLFIENVDTRGSEIIEKTLSDVFDKKNY